MAAFNVLETAWPARPHYYLEMAPALRRGWQQNLKFSIHFEIVEEDDGVKTGKQSLLTSFAKSKE